MSEREQIASLLDLVPDYKLGYVRAYLQGLTADEDADDEFCEGLLRRYEADPNPEKDRSWPLEELKKEWGL